jgi:3-mercaptopyruvate sulfurtransferase SseA
MPTVRPTVLAVVLLIIAGVSVPFATRSAAQGGPEDSPRTTLAELKKLMDAGNVIVIDVRGDQAYRAGHIPGAVSVPLETVAARAAEWASATRPVVTYCS